MIRRCDGSDPNLVMLVDPAEQRRVDGTIRRVSVEVRLKIDDSHDGSMAVAPGIGYEMRPCDCGLVFDDGERMVIWPHREV